MRCEVCVHATELLICANAASSHLPVRTHHARGDQEEHKTCVRQDSSNRPHISRNGPFASRRTTGPGREYMRATSTVDRDR